MSESENDTGGGAKSFREKIAPQVERVTIAIEEALLSFQPYDEEKISRQIALERRKLHARYPDLVFDKAGFVLSGEIESRQGAFVEVAGPTEAGYEFVDFDELPSKVHVSNITRGVIQWNDDPNNPEADGVYGDVDFQADATRLPLKDTSVGVLLAACTDRGLSYGVLQEARRVLESGGLFVWQGIYDEQVLSGKAAGFELVKYTKRPLNELSQQATGEYGGYQWNVVFQKSL